MAHSVARPARYQGGASFNVFSAQGSNPTGDCKVCGKGVQKLYDKSVKTYVYSLCGGPASKIQLPKDENKIGLQLLQPFIVFQIFVPAAQPLTLELRVSDTTNTRRKMYFSTSFSDIKSTPLHCQIPITMVTRGIWLTLSIHVANLFAHCFKGIVFKSVDTIVLGPVCKLRKIFTMRNRLSNIGSMCNSFDVSGEDYLPQEHIFALGVDNVVQVLDMMALQMTISDLSDPSNGTEDDILKLRKVKLNKSEPQQVHVAFGSRMLLPLSTVQINTSLPNDKKSHSIKAFSKEKERIDRASRSIHPQSGIPSSMYEQNQVENKVENKSETLQNLLKHANNFNKNHTMMKLKKDQILLDQGKLQTINEPTQRTSNIHFTTQELQLTSNFTTIDAFKQMQKPIEVGIEGIMALTSLTKDDMMNMLSKEDSTITHLQWSNDEIPPKHVLQLGSSNNENPKDDTLEASTNKTIFEEPTTFIKKKIEEYKLPDPEMGLGKYIRRASHIDSDRRKEYRQSKYMGSPPESPPCGWTSCIEDENEEKPLRLPSFFNKICENMEDLEKSKDNIVESTITEDSHLMDSLDIEDEGEQCTEEAIQDFLNDEDAKYDYSLEILHTERSMKDIVKSTSESIDNFMEDRPRPAGVTHKKFDLSSSDNFMFHDSEFAGAMLDEDYSFGRHSWSSNDHFQQEQGGEQYLVIDTRFSKNSHDTSQELNMFQNNNKTNDNNSPTHSLRFLNQYIDDHGSFEFDGTINNGQIEQLRSSPIITQPQSKTPYGNTKISTYNDDAPFEMSTSSSNESMESISKHSISSFTLKDDQEIIKEMEISNCIIEHEDAGITVNTRQSDEDLDLLYDPTLDCYYDPKTNRYYELK